MPDVQLREYLVRIEEMIQAGRTDEAVLHCQHILTSYSECVEAISLLGEAFRAQGLLEEAAACFHRALGADPEVAAARLGLGLVRDAEGMLGEAIWQLERAFDLAPGNMTARQELLRLYEKRDGKPKEGLKLSRAALGRIYSHNGLYDRAIQEYQSILSQDPNLPEVQVGLAEALWHDGRELEAVEACLDLLRSLPQCLKANVILGRAYLNTGRRTAAQERLRIATALDPENRVAQGMLGENSPLLAREVSVHWLQVEPPPEEEPAVPALEEGIAPPGEAAGAPGILGEEAPPVEGAVPEAEEIPAEAAAETRAAAEVPAWAEALLPPQEEVPEPEALPEAGPEAVPAEPAPEPAGETVSLEPVPLPEEEAEWFAAVAPPEQVGEALPGEAPPEPQREAWPEAVPLEALEAPSETEVPVPAAAPPEGVPLQILEALFAETVPEPEGEAAPEEVPLETLEALFAEEPAGPEVEAPPQEAPLETLEALFAEEPAGPEVEAPPEEAPPEIEVETWRTAVRPEPPIEALPYEEPLEPEAQVEPAATAVEPESEVAPAESEMLVAVEAAGPPEPAPEADWLEQVEAAPAETLPWEEEEAPAPAPAPAAAGAGEEPFWVRRMADAIAEVAPPPGAEFLAPGTPTEAPQPPAPRAAPLPAAPLTPEGREQRERITALEVQVQAQPQNFRARMELARRYRTEGRWSEALLQYEEILALHKLVPAVIHDVQQMLELDVDRVQVFRLLGDAYMEVDQVDQALEMYRLARQILRKR